MAKVIKLPGTIQLKPGKPPLKAGGKALVTTKTKAALVPAAPSPVMTPKNWLLLAGLVVMIGGWWWYSTKGGGRRKRRSPFGSAW